MLKLDLRRFAVTLLFFFGELGIVGIMAFSAAFFGPAEAFQGSAFWVSTAITTCGVAALAGLVVDSLRFLSSVAWTGKPPYRLKLKKVLRRNLA